MESAKQTSSSAAERLAAAIAGKVDTLQALAAGVQTADQQKLARIKGGLEPMLSIAAALKPQYEALLASVGPALERVAALNLENLRSQPGYTRLRDSTADARTLLADLREAIHELGALPGRVEALTLQDALDGRNHRLAEEVALHAGGPGRMEEKIQAVLACLEAFERAQRA
jgi:hypothetical protein